MTIPPWIPEDDLLLKNAVEGGASLEALAKGAVRFSRKFTLGELRDRWYSLLYDPVISKEASAKMIEFELSVTKNARAICDAEVCAKRKLESVKQLYNAMRKKTRGQPAGCRDSMEFDGNRSHFGFVGKECYNEIHAEFPSFKHGNMGNIASLNVGDEIVGFQSCGRVKEMKLRHSLPENCPSFHHAEGFSSPLAVWEMVNDVSANAIPIGVTTEDKGQQEVLMHHSGMEMDGKKACLSGMDVIHPEAILQDDDDVNVLDKSTAISECDFADLSESLLNFMNEDEQHLVNEGEKEATAKSYYDGILVTCPNDPHGNAPDVNNSSLVSDKTFEVSANTGPLRAVTEGSFSGYVKQHDHFQTELNITSTSEVNAENCDGEMECIINSEDSEIPCNDDIFLHKEFTSSRMVTPSGETGSLSLSCANLKGDQHELSLVKKEEHPAESLFACQLKTPEISHVIKPSHQLVGCGFKCLSYEDLAFRQVGNDHRAPDQHIIRHAAVNSANAGFLKPEPSHAYNITSLPLHEQACSPQQVTSVPEADLSMLNDKDSESDDDVPSYSEVEAMILQMDLFPEDTDSYIHREVSRYQNEDTRRSIIRLEQCARSSMHRALASRGALAVLYGRRLRHYIRETESSCQFVFFPAYDLP